MINDNCDRCNLEIVGATMVCNEKKYCDTCFNKQNDVTKVANAKENIQQGVKLILKGLNNAYDMDIDNENFVDTPSRVAKSFLEIASGEENTWGQIREILSKSFPSEYKGMVVESGIECFSCCPHHLLPVSYIVNIGYIPKDRCLGLSKLARIVKVLAARLVLQETLTSDITKALMLLEPLGTVIQLSGKHLCMGCRGVKQPNVVTMTSDITGAFKNPETREEFNMLVRNHG